MAGHKVGATDYYSPRDNNAMCQSCGFKYKGSQLRRRWDGFLVCRTCWHPRQPQDFVKSIQEKIKADIISTEPADSFLPQCSFNGQAAISDYAVADCAKVGNYIIQDNVPNSTF